MTWWQAAVLARQGRKVRRETWENPIKWITYNPGLFFCHEERNIHLPSGVASVAPQRGRHVIRETEFGKDEFEAGDWTDAYPIAYNDDGGVDQPPTDDGGGTGIDDPPPEGGHPRPPGAGGGDDDSGDGGSGSSRGGSGPSGGGSGGSGSSDGGDDDGGDDGDQGGGDGDKPAPPPPPPPFPPGPPPTPTPPKRKPEPKSKDSEARFDRVESAREVAFRWEYLPPEIQNGARPTAAGMAAYLNIYVTIVFKNNSDSAFSLTGRFGGVASNGGIILAKSGTKTYGYTFTYKLGFLTLYDWVENGCGVGLTSIFAGVGDEWSRCPGQRVGGFGPRNPRLESDAIEAFTSAMNKDSDDKKNQPLELRATGMGGKYAGKILPYGPVK